MIRHDPDLKTMIPEGFPVVLQGSVAGLRVPSVGVDNVTGARGAVEHLIALAHKRIGCITNTPIGNTAARERADGWRTPMRRAAPHAKEVWRGEAEVDAPSGRRAGQALLGRSPGLDAVFARSDFVALRDVCDLRAMGQRVPRDASVVGFDDVPLAAFLDPPLTTVAGLCSGSGSWRASRAGSTNRPCRVGRSRRRW